MDNAAIAEVLDQIAVLLEIKGENPFKVRAYQRAAEAVRALSQDAADLRVQGELTSLPGVGASIAETITELLDTGGCKQHADLLRDYPPGVFEMLRIPGVGPKTIKMLLDQQGIGAVEELEAAAAAGALRTLPGMGAKTEQEILRGIRRMREYGKRTNLGVAWTIAERITGQLRRDAPVEQMETAGSLRRMRETIGDIDILITSEEPETVMSCFVGLDVVSEIVAHGPTKSTILTDDGLQIDLRVVPAESFGAALQYFTGSKDHNVRLRDLGVRSHIKLNEYGIFRVEGGDWGCRPRDDAVITQNTQ